jgi:hypothetical protein
MKSQESQKDQERGLIITTAGKPFQTIQSAGLVMRAKSLDPSTHEIVQVQGGYAIAPKGDIAPTAPRPSVAAAVPGATGIPAAQVGVSAPATIVPMPAEPEIPAEKVWWGKFAPKSKESDTEAVVLAVGGDVIQAERDKLIPLPERYWDCARNGTYPQYRQLPGIPRKIVAKIRTYNFEIVREGTWAEFEAERKAGTKKTRDDMERDLLVAELAATASQAQV